MRHVTTACLFGLATSLAWAQAPSGRDAWGLLLAVRRDGEGIAGVHHQFKVPAEDHYRTLWIRPQGGHLLVRQLDNVWLPRDGTFWRVVVRRQTAKGWSEDQVAAAPNGKNLSWPAHLSGGVTTCGYLSRRVIYVGRHYLSSWQMSEGQTVGTDQTWLTDGLCTTSLSECNKAVPLQDVCKDPALQFYQDSAAAWWEDHPASQEALARQVNDKQWGVVRREGTWIVAGQLGCSGDAYRGAFSIFDLPVCPPPTLVNDDGLTPAWQEVSDSIHGALDGFTSPGHQVLGVVTPRRLTLYPMVSDTVNFKNPHWTLPLNGREFPVMTQWSQDPEDWDKQLLPNVVPGDPIDVPLSP